MELTIKERIILIMYYLILFSGLVMLIVNIMDKYKHGEVIGTIAGFLFFYLWITVLDIKKSIEGRKFNKRLESYCKTCKYMKENEIK